MSNAPKQVVDVVKENKSNVEKSYESLGRKVKEASIRSGLYKIKKSSTVSIDKAAKKVNRIRKRPITEEEKGLIGKTRDYIRRKGATIKEGAKTSNYNHKTNKVSLSTNSRLSSIVHEAGHLSSRNLTGPKAGAKGLKTGKFNPALQPTAHDSINSTRQTYGNGLRILAEEARASYGAQEIAKKLGASKKTLRKIRQENGKAFGTYTSGISGYIDRAHKGLDFRRELKRISKQ